MRTGRRGAEAFPPAGARSLPWLPHGAGYRAEVSADMHVRVAPFGCSWSWTLVEGGVPAASGIASTQSDAFDAAARQARQWPILIKGATRHE